MSGPTEMGDRKTRYHIPFYDDVLKVTEVWLVLILLFVVILATFLNILDRNFGLDLWEYAIVEKMVYSFTFFIGLFGGVIASRRAKHIAIDAVTHFLPTRTRAGLAVVLQLIGAMTCFMLTYAAYDWLYSTIEEHVTLLEGRTEWWLSTRLWRWPTVIAFGWMGLHFLVNAGRFYYDFVKPPERESAEGESR